MNADLKALNNCAAKCAELEARWAEAEAARLITRATLTDARRFVVMVCGETAPYAKIMLERIDKALADSQHRPADSAEVAPKPGVCRHCGQYLDRRGKCRNPEHNS